MPLKVLHITPSVGLARGGPTEVVLNLVKALRNCGVEAEIATTNDDFFNVLDVPLHQVSEYQGVPVWFFPRFSTPWESVSLGSDRGFVFSVAWTRWLWQNLRNYDILDNHYLFSYGSTCAGAIARQQNIPYTVRAMGQLSPWALAQSWRKKQLYSLLIERRNLQQAAAIHCTSSGEANDVRNFGLQTPTLDLPLGVRLPEPLPEAKTMLRTRYNIAPETPIILFLSRLHYKKRPDRLLEILKNLDSTHQFHLILAGSGESEYIKKLEVLSQQLGLENRVTFAGFVSGKKKDLLLQGADLFALPSYAENFAIAVAEAMSAGLPVVITPGVQIAPEVARAGAGLVADGDSKAFGEAIAQLLASPDRRHQLGTNGRKLVREQYAWEAIAPQLAQAYQAIVDRKPIPTQFDRD